MINVEEDSIKKIAVDVKNAGNDVNVYEIEARLSALLSYTKFKLVEANDQVEHISIATDDIEGYNDSTGFVLRETKKIIDNIKEDYKETGI